jgi:hypothetical protein
MTWGVTGATTALLLAALGGGWVVATYGSLRAAVAAMSGQKLFIEPDLLDLGTTRAGDTRTVVVRATNYSAQPVRIIGGNSDCSCVATRDLPVTVGAGETRELTIQIAPPHSAGVFQRRGYLLVEDGSGIGSWEFTISALIVTAP